MIRINLLPIEEWKRKASIKKHVTIYLVTVAILIVALGFLYVRVNASLAELKEEKEALVDREAIWKKKVVKVDELKEQQEVLYLKLEVIDGLQAERRGPVRILDEISRRTPPGRAWLLDLNKSNEQLTLKGIAMDNETIAVYIQRLSQLKKVEVLLRTMEEFDLFLNTLDQVKKIDELKDRLTALKALKDKNEPLERLIKKLEALEDLESLKSQKDQLQALIKEITRGKKPTHFYFDNVELVRSTQEVRGEMRLKSFSITCKIVVKEEKPPEEEEEA